MRITKLIDFPVFIISLCIGLFFAYMIAPNPDIIFVYPTPDNRNKLLFKDKAGVCHSFTPHKVKCPTDKSRIRKYPIHIKK